MKSRLSILLLSFLILPLQIVYAGSDTRDPYETCEEGVHYYNFYLFSEYVNTVTQTYPSVKFAQPYDYFSNSQWLYKFGSHGAIPVSNSNSGSTVSAGGETVYTSSWSKEYWWKILNDIYDNAQKFNSLQVRSNSTVVRFIISGNSSSSNAYKCSDYNACSQGRQPNCDGQTQASLINAYNQAHYSASHGTISYPGSYDKTVSIPPATWIQYTYTSAVKSDLGAYSIFDDSDYYRGEFYGVNDGRKKFKIYRNYNCFKNENNPSYIPAVFYIEYTCRRQCDPATECCYDKYGNYQDDYKDSSPYNYKYVHATKVGDRYVVQGQGKKSSYYNYKKTCGCDPSQACCHDVNGTLQSTFDKTNKPQDTSDVSYRYVKNYGKNEQWPDWATEDSLSGSELERRGYRKVSCGCEPKKMCCYDSNGRYSYDMYRTTNVSNKYTVIKSTANSDDYSSSAKEVVSCNCKGNYTTGICGGTESYDEVKNNTGGGKTNDATCTMKGQYTNSGYSMLENNYNGISYKSLNPGYDVVCKNSFEVQYPQKQAESRENLGRFFTFNSANISNKVATVKITKTCISSYLSNSTMTSAAANKVFGSDSVLSSNVSKIHGYIYYEDIDDISEFRGKRRDQQYLPLKVTNNSALSSTKRYYSSSSAAPSSFTLDHEMTNSNQASTYGASYVSSISTVSFDLTVPPIYLRGSMGDTIFQPSSPTSYVATIPKDSLPIMLTSGANNSKELKIKINIGNILNRPRSGESRNYTAKKTNYSSDEERNFVQRQLNTGNDINLEKTCDYSTVDKTTRVEPKKEKFLYRTVSLANINPTNRVLGDNWNPTNRVGAFNTLTSVDDKKLKIDSKRAYILLKDTSSENYIPKTDNYSNLTNERKGVFTFELTPVTMAAIRNYNSDIRVKAKGGYDNWSLVLVDYEGTDNANTLFGDRYKQQAYACGWHWYSPFLSYLAGESNATVSIERCASSIKYNSEDMADLRNNIDINIVGDETMSISELKKSRYNLIHKQNVLDQNAYSNAGGR